MKSSDERYLVHRDAVIAAVTMVLSMGTSTPDRLRYNLMQIREVVAHGICHGAAGALTTAHLHLCHQMDLRRLTPGFLMVEIPNDVNVKWLVVEFSGNTKAITTVIDMEQIIKDAPL